MISVDEALSHIRENRPARKTEIISLHTAHGRQLAQDVIAKVSKPPTDVSAMDGYAVRLADVQSPNAKLAVIGETPAGAPFAGSVKSGEAVRLFTGSTIPKGTDHVIIQENVERDGDTLLAPGSYQKQANIRKAGLDFCTGDTVLKASSNLSPYALAIASAANHASVSVFKKLNVAILSNGNELKPPGSELKFGDIVSSNAATLCALTEQWGANTSDLGIAKDSVDAICTKVEAAENETDIYIAIGGASVGDYDYMKRAFSDLGFQFIFEKVAVKPGKPTWFARSNDQLVIGLPGNPASAFVCATLFVKPLLESHNTLNFLKARTRTTLEPVGAREVYLRATAEIDQNAELWVTPTTNQDSSRMTPFLTSNCLLRRPTNSAKSFAGDVTEILLFDRIYPPTRSDARH